MNLKSLKIKYSVTEKEKKQTKRKQKMEQTPEGHAGKNVKLLRENGLKGGVVLRNTGG